MAGELNMLNKLIAISALLFLTGCATMSKDECLHADWYIKGLSDATEGFALSRIDDHAKACARVAVKPNMQDYESGHKKGARLYCVPEKGYSEGRNGAAYNGICPVELEKNFLNSYSDGRELFDIQQKINQMTNNIANNQSRIQSDYNEIHDLKNAIVDRDSYSQERRNNLHRIDELEYEIRDLDFSIDRDSRELELFRNDYRIVEEKHRRMGYMKYQ